MRKPHPESPSLRPNPHWEGRGANQVNGTCCWEWDCPNWMQATSKELPPNLRARIQCGLGLKAATTNQMTGHPFPLSSFTICRDRQKFIWTGLDVVLWNMTNGLEDSPTPPNEKNTAGRTVRLGLSPISTQDWTERQPGLLERLNWSRMLWMYFLWLNEARVAMLCRDCGRLCGMMPVFPLKKNPSAVVVFI